MAHVFCEWIYQYLIALHEAVVIQSNLFGNGFIFLSRGRVDDGLITRNRTQEFYREI